jgi:hypothetical protein
MAQHADSQDRIEPASPECYITTEEEADRLISRVRLLVFVFGDLQEQIFYDPDANEIYVFPASISVENKLREKEQQRKAAEDANNARDPSTEATADSSPR